MIYVVARRCGVGMGRGQGQRLVVIFFVKELFFLSIWVRQVIEFLIVALLLLVRRRMLGIALASLSVLLALPAFHLRFLKKPPFFGQPLAFEAVLTFVLSDKGFGWRTEDALVFAKLADPNVLSTWRVSIVRILLLHSTLASGYRVLPTRLA